MTDIEWTDESWNPIAGCTPVSPGCTNCYAARHAVRLEKNPIRGCRKYIGTVARTPTGRPYYIGVLNVDEEVLDKPLHWRKPRKVFVNSMSDLFHENLPVAVIQRVFDVMGRCPKHTFQVLTKRPERALELSGSLPWPENIWMGTSVEQQGYVGRVADLVKIPAKVRFISAEPLLGALALPLDGIDWLIAGGESGPRARPTNAEWVRALRDDCVRQRVAFFFKQWGGVSKKKNGRQLDGRIWEEYPAAA